MRIMCLDIGDKRIGVAISDPLGVIASPLTVLSVTNKQKALKEILDLISKQEVKLIVFGVPYNEEGKLSEQCSQNNFYLKGLKNKVNIDFCDERYSTVDAYDSLLQLGIDRRKGKKAVDMISASLILQRYLEKKDNHARV